MTWGEAKQEIMKQTWTSLCSRRAIKKPRTASVIGFIFSYSTGKPTERFNELRDINKCSYFVAKCCTPLCAKYSDRKDIHTHIYIYTYWCSWAKCCSPVWNAVCRSHTHRRGGGQLWVSVCVCPAEVTIRTHQCVWDRWWWWSSWSLIWIHISDWNKWFLCIFHTNVW